MAVANDPVQSQFAANDTYQWMGNNGYDPAIYNRLTLNINWNVKLLNGGFDPDSQGAINAWQTYQQWLKDEIDDPVRTDYSYAEWYFSVGLGAGFGFYKW